MFKLQYIIFLSLILIIFTCGFELRAKLYGPIPRIPGVDVIAYDAKFINKKL